MPDLIEDARPPDARPASWAHGACVDLRLGGVIEVKARATPAFMLSVAALVVGILLGVAAIIRSTKRSRPA